MHAHAVSKYSKMNFFYFHTGYTEIPYELEYSSATFGQSFVVSNCDNIAYNGIEGCSNITVYDIGCGNNTLSVHCERGEPVVV